MTRKRSKRIHRKTQRGGMKRNRSNPDPLEYYPQDQSITSIIEDGITHDQKVVDLIDKMSRLTPYSEPCFHTTQTSLSILKRGITKLEENFNQLLKPLYINVLAEVLEKERLPYVPYDKSLYMLFYQNMKQADIEKIYRILSGSLNSSEPTFLTPEARNSRLGVILHSYIYKLLTGLGTQYTSIEAVLNYVKGSDISIPNGAPFSKRFTFSLPKLTGGTIKKVRGTRKNLYRGSKRPIFDSFSELRNLCLLMRDTLGLVNHLFRAAWSTQLPGVDIGDTQYCHSGGNIFYIMSMMLCYLHSHKDNPIYNADILEQIRYAFDTELGGEKHEFYKYLDAFMENQTCRELIMKNTLSMSDVDFLILTSDEYLLRERRMEMKNITMMVAGQLLSECCKGLPATPGLRTDNIALKVILPKRTVYSDDWPKFKISDFTDTPYVLKDMINRLEQVKLQGTRVTASEIDALQIYLVRIKVAINAGVTLTEEFKKIFAEKLDFVIGSLENSFYKEKQNHFVNCDYYSLITFFNELFNILLNPSDDKSGKRMDRFSIFKIFLLIEQMAGDDPKQVVEKAVEMCKILDFKPVLPKPKCWFNLLMGTIFMFLDPTTKNKASANCSDTLCRDGAVLHNMRMKNAATSMMYQSVKSSILSTGQMVKPFAVMEDTETLPAGEETAPTVLERDAATYEELVTEMKTLSDTMTATLHSELEQPVAPRIRSRSAPRIASNSKETKRTRIRSKSVPKSVEGNLLSDPTFEGNSMRNKSKE